MTSSLPKLLITGGKGQVAQALKHHALSKDYQLILLDKQDLDIRDISAIDKVLQIYKPDAVINTAAYTAVDKAETEQELAFAINHQGAANLAQACQKHNLPLIHLSTDYVFDGKQQTPYHESDPTHPLNVYGQSKLQGEQAVLAQCDQAIILRVTSIFSEYGHNFLKTILRLAKEKNHLRIVKDQIVCPTYAGDIAYAIFSLLENKNKAGIYHYCSQEAISWHGFASAIVEQATAYTDLAVQEIEAIPASDYPTPAQRPAYSVLNCERIGISLPDWQQGISLSLKRIYT